MNTYRVSLVGLHQDEDVVHADGEDEEGDDLEDDERRLHAHEPEDAHAGPHREQHDQHAAQAQGHLALQLKFIVQSDPGGLALSFVDLDLGCSTILIGQ